MFSFIRCFQIVSKETVPNYTPDSTVWDFSCSPSLSILDIGNISPRLSFGTKVLIHFTAGSVDGWWLSVEAASVNFPQVKVILHPKSYDFLWVYLHVMFRGGSDGAGGAGGRGGRNSGDGGIETISKGHPNLKVSCKTNWGLYCRISPSAQSYFPHTL